MTITSPVVRTDEGAHLPMIDGDHIAKTTVRDAHGTFEVFEVHAPAGPPAPPHISPWSAVLYVLDGSLTVLVDSATCAVGPGDLVTLPAGTPCTFTVTGDNARFLAVTTGDGAGRFFADAAASVPAGPPAPASIAAMRAVTARHGVRLPEGDRVTPASPGGNDARTSPVCGG
ncbi:cupin domain-containing protein [Cellulomonas sp. ATA003]|uniref:cupin domain-containing protein n=1 Tax=Cellulomonas sp. ATA003 TaxID=3073064 RepID=UPI002872D572|nr:cupin domain-containing protein [Cellulomonas sp. ATA003]WNB86552.1 cupin domain-containing protein [Cellulomonas sp. ATA003]